MPTDEVRHVLTVQYNTKEHHPAMDRLMDAIRELAHDGIEVQIIYPSKET